MQTSIGVLSLVSIGIFYLCTAEASTLWMEKRDKAADIETAIRAGRVLLQRATDEELKKMNADFKKCLASADQSLIESIPLQAAADMKGREFDDLDYLIKRLFRQKRSDFEYLSKRDRNADIEEILASGRKLLNEMTAEDVKKVAFLDRVLDSLTPEQDRKYLDDFNRLADKCTKRRREFLLDFDDK